MTGLLADITSGLAKITLGRDLAQGFRASEQMHALAIAQPAASARRAAIATSRHIRQVVS
ncbi:MAG TPA: hypothetical protein VID30_12635 [Bradyrhizobium sp.]|jgi:hypothetical protein